MMSLLYIWRHLCSKTKTGMSLFETTDIDTLTIISISVFKTILICSGKTAKHISLCHHSTVYVYCLICFDNLNSKDYRMNNYVTVLTK